jgi:hypothetical protein
VDNPYLIWFVCRVEGVSCGKTGPESPAFPRTAGHRAVQESEAEVTGGGSCSTGCVSAATAQMHEMQTAWIAPVTYLTGSLNSLMPLCIFVRYHRWLQWNLKRAEKG